MDKQAQKQILDGILAFQPTIRFTTTADPKKTIAAALSMNPRLVYYLSGWTMTSCGTSYEMQMRYNNQETKLSEICTVQSKEECLHRMCQAVGDYKKQLVVVSQTPLDAQKISDEFHEKHATFYAHMVQFHITGFRLLDSFSAYCISFQYRIGQVKLNMMELEVDAEVERIGKLLFYPGMPKEAKVYLAHNYLALTVTYVDSEKNPLDTSYTQSAYGALIRHRCVCQGYAEAFKRLMDYAGIECDVVCGQVVGSDEYHAWNIISFGTEDSCCHVDTTWDRSTTTPKYVHFCKNDSHYVGNRIWNRTLNHRCPAKHPVMSVARNYILLNKKLLLRRGIDPRVLDC